MFGFGRVDPPQTKVFSPAGEQIILAAKGKQGGVLLLKTWRCTQITIVCMRVDCFRFPYRLTLRLNSFVKGKVKVLKRNDERLYATAKQRTYDRVKVHRLKEVENVRRILQTRDKALEFKIETDRQRKQKLNHTCIPVYNNPACYAQERCRARSESTSVRERHGEPRTTCTSAT